MSEVQIRTAMGYDKLDAMTLPELQDRFKRAKRKLDEYNSQQRTLYPQRTKLFVEILEASPDDTENLLRLDGTLEWLRSEISKVDSLWEGMNILRNAIELQIIERFGARALREIENAGE
jgi:predicted transcriptional regulator